VGEGIRGVWLLALPSSVGLVVLAKPVVELLFEGGRFLPSDTLATVPIVQAYMVGVLPYSLVKVFAPGFFVVGKTRIPMIASILSVVANLVFNGLFYRRLGAAGLAIGTTVGALVNLMVLRLFFVRFVGRPSRSGWVRDTFLLFLANGLLALVAGACWKWGVGWLVHLPIAWPFGLKRAIHGIGLFVTIGVAFLAYVAMLKGLKVQGAADLWDMPGRILRKFRRN
jgi:putative peptidoglycan lipid II flippase